MPDRVAAANVDETPRPGEPPRLYARRVASEKARALAQPGVLTLAADTVVAVGQRILPKAANADEVRRCLALLSGRRHHVITAVHLIGADGRAGERVVDSVVAFARFPPADIEAYAAGNEGVGKAGGYAIQGSAAAFVRFLSGSYSGVVGLPLWEVAQLLRGRGYRIPCPPPT